jgi:hypothetical protein
MMQDSSREEYALKIRVNASQLWVISVKKTHATLDGFKYLFLFPRILFK